ncbi:MAG: DNA alkylation repair protein [Planctomycetota bacterium]|nr:MAG: DNA alkylation repair protein [Planctomycetota bacterium]
MQLNELMTELERRGSEQTRKIYRNQGVQCAMYGVKIGDLKVIAKKIKGDQALALELFRTGNMDAMYLAGLVANGGKMSRKELEGWARAASSPMIAEYTVAWVASESPHARELALEWIDSSMESMACAGWNTYSALLAVRPDSELDLDEIEGLLRRVEKGIHKAPNRVRYCMNNFVIAVGGSVKPLLAKAKAVAKRIGKVEVDMGKTACEVPPAFDTIAKIESMGRVGTKRKTAKC